MASRRPGRRWFLANALAGAGLVFSAGGTLRAAADELSQEAASRGAVTFGGSYWVEWTPNPDPVPFNEVFSIHFRVLYPGNRDTQVVGAVLTADASMPEHQHGMSLEPRIEVHEDGTATGNGFLFHMEGRWELAVGVAVGGRMEQAVFSIDLEP